MKRPLISLVVALAASALLAQEKPPAAPGAAMGAGIVTRTLDNGLKIIVWPDRDIPNVALYNWFRAGSRNERPGITGLSHFFEHMMFNGSKKYAPGEFDRVMEANGGANNAYTSENVTVYQDWFPKSALPVIFDLEGDRLANLAIDPKVVDSEREVVYSERRLRVDNDNFGMLMEQVQATAFVAHPYQFPVIGWPSDIESWSQQDLERYFRTYYAPNNATMIVVGDVDPQEIFRLAEKHIGSIPRQPAPDPIRTIEPEQKGERRVSIRKEAQVPVWMAAYHIGSATDPDREALELLVAILSNGQSSRLYRRLVDQERIAINAGTFADRGFDPSLAWVYMTLTAGADPAKAETIVDEELERIITAGVTADELAKAKNQALAAFWRSLKTISGKAQALGGYEVFNGDYRLLFTAPERYEAVTAEQIREVARRTFTRNNRTVGVLIPEEATSRTPETSR